MLGFELMIRRHFSPRLEVPTMVKSGLKINKNKIVVDRIRTHDHASFFTVVGSFNRGEKWLKNNYKKKVVSTMIRTHDQT